MSLHRLLLAAAAVLLVALAATTAYAATADSVSVDISNSKPLRRLALFADVSECDGAGGYGCYTASFSIYTRGGTRIYKKALTFNASGQAKGRYPWSCRHAGRLQWRVRVSDGESAAATRRGNFNVTGC